MIYPAGEAFSAVCTARNRQHGLAHTGPQATGHQHSQEWSGEFHTPPHQTDFSAEQDTVRQLIDFIFVPGVTQSSDPARMYDPCGRPSAG